MELTVLIEPIVCSTTIAAFAYAVCPFVAILEMNMVIKAPAATRKGMTDNITNVRSHPLINATTNPPMNVDIS